MPAARGAPQTKVRKIIHELEKKHATYMREQRKRPRRMPLAHWHAHESAPVRLNTCTTRMHRYSHAS
jgi:hypothetical protein